MAIEKSPYDKILDFKLWATRRRNYPHPEVVVPETITGNWPEDVRVARKKCYDTGCSHILDCLRQNPLEREIDLPDTMRRLALESVKSGFRRDAITSCPTGQIALYMEANFTPEQSKRPGSGYRNGRFATVTATLINSTLQRESLEKEEKIVIPVFSDPHEVGAGSPYQINKIYNR